VRLLISALLLLAVASASAAEPSASRPTPDGQGATVAVALVEEREAAGSDVEGDPRRDPAAREDGELPLVDEGPRAEQISSPRLAAAEGDELVIGGVSVLPGQVQEIFLQSSESFSGGDVKMPLVVVRGSEPGPVLCLTAGIHGDELNGIQIVREVLDLTRPETLKGTVIGVPIMNLFGFWNQSRFLPDRRDLNRHFPGRPTGSTASRIAHRIWSEVVSKCSHLIDFHTGSLHRSNLPQIRGDLRKRKVRKLAEAFGADVVVHNPGQRGTLRSEAVRAGIPAILYEAGETMRFQRREIRRGVQGTMNVMIELGMREGEKDAAPTAETFLETHWVRAPQGGIVELFPNLGEWVEKGDVIGEITDPLRKVKGSVVSPHRGRIIGKVLSPTVIPGLAVLHVGIPDGRMERTEAGADELDLDRPE